MENIETINNTPLIQEEISNQAEIQNQPNNMKQFDIEIKKDVPNNSEGNKNIPEIVHDPINGNIILVVIIIFFLLSFFSFLYIFYFKREKTGDWINPYKYPKVYLLPVPLLSLGIGLFLGIGGLFNNPPNTAAIFLFCDVYKYTVKKSGFFFVNPFYIKSLISLKTETYNSPIVKVNDKIGNPIKVGCVIMWRVKDCNKANFDVQNYRSYLHNQCESAVRYVGCLYPYDKVNEEDISLRSGNEIVHQTLKEDLAKRLERAGIEVEDARITEISYSTEISNAMLKRQAAEAVVAAREKIVHGAVDIINQACLEMETKNICKMSNKEKSRMVGNLMVVLCSDNQSNTMINTS